MGCKLISNQSIQRKTAMRKILIAMSFAVITMAACKKDPDNVSTVQTVSRPTIILPGAFYSINTGGTLPTITGTAYDSFLKESYPVEIVGTEALDNTTPGLYVISAKSTNKYGFYSKSNIYVAVTDISPNIHLEGNYVRAATGYVMHVTRLANGLYSVSNFFGVAGLDADAYFAHLKDSIIAMPPQSTSLGLLETSSQKVKMAPGDTTLSWVLQTLTTNRSLRVFKKQ